MSPTTERAMLTAPDISCDHCIATIRRALSNLDGVSHVEADAVTKQVQVDFDPRHLSLGDLEATLEEEGYPVQK